VFLRDLLPDVINTRYQRLCETTSTIHPNRKEFFKAYKERVKWWVEDVSMKSCIKARFKAEQLNTWMKKHKEAVHSICDAVRCLFSLEYLFRKGGIVLSEIYFTTELKMNLRST